MTKIGFLGLGMMGSGMASCLLKAGYDVTVWNRSPDKADALVKAGAKRAASPKETALGAEVVFSMVADDAASNQCWLDEDGALGALESGAFVVECSTISHGQSVKLAEATSARGLRYIDCPVNGPPSGAAAGELILLVGADPADLEFAKPWLETISSSILHFGPVGTGTAYKLINNLLGAVHVASIAEAVNLARKLGLNVDTMVEAVKSGPVGSPHTNRNVRPMLEGRRNDSFGLAIGLREKDARYCLAMADSMDLKMTIGEDAHAWYVAASEKFGADDDAMMLNTVAAHNGKAPARK